MRLEIRWSKRYLLGINLAVGGLAAAFVLAPEGLNGPAKIFVLALTAAIFLFSLKILLSNKPVLVADETGILDTRLGSTPIAWNEIRAFRHVPREDVSTNGQKSSSLFEAWRPIQLWIKPAPNKTFRRKGLVRQHPTHLNFPAAQHVLIDFSGLDTPSSRLAELIRQRAPHAREGISGASLNLDSNSLIP